MSHRAKTTTVGLLSGALGALCLAAAASAGNGHLLVGAGLANANLRGPGEAIAAFQFDPALLTQFEDDEVTFACELFVDRPEGATDFDPARRRVRFEGGIVDLANSQPGSLPALGFRHTSRTHGVGFGLVAIAGFRTDHRVDELPEQGLFLARITLLGENPPEVPIQGRCTASQLEPPCAPSETNACIGSDLRWKIGAKRNGTPLRVQRFGEFFAIFDTPLEVQVFGQCGDPDIRGYTVQIDSPVPGVVVDVTDTQTGASGYYFPRAGQRLLDFGGFPSCP